LAPGASAILDLLADGVPRTRRDLIGALAVWHGREEVVRTLLCLAVTGRLAETSGKFTLPVEDHTPAATR
jgi:hypothetical protein